MIDDASDSVNGVHDRWIHEEMPIGPAFDLSSRSVTVLVAFPQCSWLKLRLDSVTSCGSLTDHSQRWSR